MSLLHPSDRIVRLDPSRVSGTDRLFWSYLHDPSILWNIVLNMHYLEVTLHSNDSSETFQFRDMRCIMDLLSCLQDISSDISTVYHVPNCYVANFVCGINLVRNYLVQSSRTYWLLNHAGHFELRDSHGNVTNLALFTNRLTFFQTIYFNFGSLDAYQNYVVTYALAQSVFLPHDRFFGSSSFGDDDIGPGIYIGGVLDDWDDGD